MHSLLYISRVCGLLAMLLATPPCLAEEGMWPLDNLPAHELQETYAFTPTPEWIEHVRLSSIRLSDGGSGGFVSPNGLVITNQHAALGQLSKVSTATSDYVRHGFFARTRAEEMRCPDLELNVLVSTEEVTARVLGVVQAQAPLQIQNEQRKGEIARIEKESTDRTGLRSDVVELYQGGEYWLHRYKKYTDVRLVMATEQQAALFGGSFDNFTYPRYALDFAFFRAYENGNPVHSKHYFHWSREGVREKDLVFALGHPEATNRQLTVKQLEFRRDIMLPAFIDVYRRVDQALLEYAARGDEPKRRAGAQLYRFENELKRATGEMEALRKSSVFAARATGEKDLRSRVSGNAALAATSSAWDRIAGAQRERARRFKESLYRSIGPSRLGNIAVQIVRYVAEVEKDNATRLEEYRSSALESLRYQLLSAAPIYPDYEEYLLALALSISLEHLGPGDAHVRAALGGRPPEEVAHRLVTGTRLADVEFRKRLVAGGVKAVEASDDPLIVWAQGLDASYRELRKWLEDRIESVEKLEGGRIARARFEVYGEQVYPDATSTLRLSYGTVAGYSEGTTRVPYKTTFAGMYGRAASFDNEPPFDLPPPVAKHRRDVDLLTPIAFVSTNDAVGGNSGSPVLNRNAELVGLHFDRNIQALARDVTYDSEQGRSVCMDAEGILVALRKIYGMDALAEEISSTGSTVGRKAGFAKASRPR